MLTSDERINFPRLARSAFLSIRDRSEPPFVKTGGFIQLLIFFFFDRITLFVFHLSQLALIFGSSL